MITFKELSKKELTSLTEEQIANVTQLHYRLNCIRRVFDEPMVITSGVRTMEEHKAIYELKNAQRLVSGRPEIRVPMGSLHLLGAAADVYDPHRKLQKFLDEREDLLVQFGLWCEDFEFTPNWVHFQIYPPKSEKRFFRP